VGAAALDRALKASSLVLAAWALATWALAARGLALAGAAAARYHGYSDLYSAPPPQQYGQSTGSQVLMPPVAWLYQDLEAARAACPFLLGLCAAAAVGLLLQKVPCGPLSFQRLAVFYPPTLKAGELWRLLTHALLHSDLSHLLMNLLHIVNLLDLEGVIPGEGYPTCYSLGTFHVACAAAVATAFGALVGSVPYFGAMFEGASALCFGLDGALLGSCGLLLGAGASPSLAGFMQVRGWYAVVHVGLDLIRGCSGNSATVGTLSHLAGFVGGLCYVLAALPDLGGQPVPTVPCLRAGPGGRFVEAECLAFFSIGYKAPVQQVRQAAVAVLACGAAAAVFNAFVVQSRAHASADGYSLLVKPPSAGARPAAADRDLDAALAASRQTYDAEQRRRLT